MAHVPQLDHVGITVEDLDTVTDFFVSLGLEVDGERSIVEGAFVSTVTGIDDARTEVVMLSCPEGGTRLELSASLRPSGRSALRQLSANDLGLRSLCFEVDDPEDTASLLGDAGHELVGGIAERDGVWLMAHVRGPEAIIVSLAQDVA